MSCRRAYWSALLLVPALAGANVSPSTVGPARPTAAEVFTAPAPAPPSALAPPAVQLAGVDPPAEGPTGHEADQGLRLGPETGETVAGDGTCPTSAPRRNYDVVAIDVDITLNRSGDHDPLGRMYTLASRLDAVRAAESQKAAAVSLGLQGDVIQPLVLRVIPGECLSVHFTNQLADEPASFHLHDSALVVAGGGGSATAANPAAMAAPGASVDYEWMVLEDEQEGTRLFHSSGEREGADRSRPVRRRRRRTAGGDVGRSSQRVGRRRRMGRGRPRRRPCRLPRVRHPVPRGRQRELLHPERRPAVTCPWSTR